MKSIYRRGFLIAGGAGLLAGCGGGGDSAARAGAPANAAKDRAAEAAYPPLGRLYGAPGARVHATDDGRGDGPPVILIHGASGNVRDFTFDIAPRLSTKRRTIAMDRPGFGYSDRSGEDAWRPTAQAAQLRAAAAEMGAEKPIVVGHSWGAAVALAWALEAPEAVTGVVAVSGVTTPWGGLVPALDALGFGSLIAGMYTRRITRTAEEGGVERFIQRAFRPQTPPPGYLDYVGAPLALRGKTLDANAEDLANTNPGVRLIAPGYPDLTTPVEILHGDRDWLLDIDQHGVELAETLPNGRLTPLPGVGHMAHHARLDALTAAVDRLAAL